MKTQLRTDIPSLDTRQTAVVLIPDFYQEGMHAIVFTFYECLSKDNSIVGQER